MTDRSDPDVAAWIALLLYAVYLLSFGGRFYSQDSMLMFSVTASFVKRGEFNADQMWTIYKARDELGPDGEAYSKTGYGASLLAAPLYALALALPEVGLSQTTMLATSIAIALSGALVFLACRRLGFARPTSAATALLFALATPAWVYAKQFWSEPFTLFTLFAAFFFLLRFRDTLSCGDAVVAGIALGLAVATRLTNAALVPFFAWYGFSNRAERGTSASSNVLSQPTETLRPKRRRFRDLAADLLLPSRRQIRGLVWFTAVLALFALSIAWYDWVRYGSPLNSGYRPDETFDNPILLGLYGLLFSPGKGLFVYVPFLAILPCSTAMFFRSARRELYLIAVVAAIYLATFSTWYYWWGGTNWGPRFLVPLLPFLVLLAAPAVDLALRCRSSPAPAGRSRWTPRAFASIFLALCVVSMAFELVGISVPALAYRARMARVSANPEWDAIFVPADSPLVGSLEIFKPSVLDFAWLRALDGTVNVDWPVVVLTAGVIVVCGVALWRLLVSIPAGQSTLAEISAFRLPQSAAAVMVLLLAALSLFSLYRYRDDFRIGGSDGYRALLVALQSDASSRDVLVLDDDILTPFFLNQDRSSARWYGLSRDPNQWDESTRALLDRLSRQYSRVWLAYDDSTASLADPTRAWLDDSLVRVDERDLTDGVHLVLYQSNSLR